MYHTIPELGFTPGAGTRGNGGCVFAIYYDD